jgi:NTE family protein
MSGAEVVLKDGKVADAVRGSLSLPFFFQPFFLNGRYLVDGGLTNPVPTSVATAMGANILISVNLTAKPSDKHMAGFRNRRRYSSSYMKGPNILEVMMKTIYTMQFEIAHARAELSHVVLAPDMSHFAWSDFHRAPDIIKIGEAMMEETMPKIKTLLPLYSDHCRVPLKRAANSGY